jgi:hypothetical protein
LAQRERGPGNRTARGNERMKIGGLNAEDSI